MFFNVVEGEQSDSLSQPLGFQKTKSLIWFLIPLKLISQALMVHPNFLKKCFSNCVDDIVNVMKQYIEMRGLFGYAMDGNK